MRGSRALINEKRSRQIAEANSHNGKEWPFSASELLIWRLFKQKEARFENDRVFFEFRASRDALHIAEKSLGRRLLHVVFVCSGCVRSIVIMSFVQDRCHERFLRWPDCSQSVLRSRAEFGPSCRTSRYLDRRSLWQCGWQVGDTEITNQFTGLLDRSHPLRESRREYAAAIGVGSEPLLHVVRNRRVLRIMIMVDLASPVFGSLILIPSECEVTSVVLTEFRTLLKPHPQYRRCSRRFEPAESPREIAAPSARSFRCQCPRSSADRFAKLLLNHGM